MNLRSRRLFLDQDLSWKQGIQTLSQEIYKTVHKEEKARIRPSKNAQNRRFKQARRYLWKIFNRRRVLWASRVLGLALFSVFAILGIVGMVSRAYGQTMSRFWTTHWDAIIISIFGSFIGSAPGLLIGFWTTLGRIRRSFSRQDEPRTPSDILAEMRKDLSTKLIFIQMGHFSTWRPEYHEITKGFLGQDSIWDYHIYVPPRNQRDWHYLMDFLKKSVSLTVEGEQISVRRKPDVRNCQIVHAGSLENGTSVRENYDRMISRFGLRGYTDIIITGSYPNESGGIQKPIVPLQALQRNQFGIRHITVFFEDEPYVRTIDPDMHDDFIESMLEYADPEAEGNISVELKHLPVSEPSLSPEDSLQGEDPMKNIVRILETFTKGSVIQILNSGPIPEAQEQPSTSATS